MMMKYMNKKRQNNLNLIRRRLRDTQDPFNILDSAFLKKKKRRREKIDKKRKEERRNARKETYMHKISYKMILANNTPLSIGMSLFHFVISQSRVFFHVR